MTHFFSGDRTLSFPRFSPRSLHSLPHLLEIGGRAVRGEKGGDAETYGGLDLDFEVRTLDERERQRFDEVDGRMRGEVWPRESMTDGRSCVPADLRGEIRE